MKKRSERHEVIREIIRGEHIKTQRDLVASLRARGYASTQATISRDIADMGLRKLPEGVYMLAEDLHLQRMVADLVLDVAVANNLLVIKASTGTAAGVAAALDAAELPGVVGSLAGDDTILVIAQDNEQAQLLETAIKKLRLQ
ncbi:MAG: ArgR family transcriptional regulator [Coriobacteriales bacterium]|nr:ArgR family transcriptional regulator [Coriobacteriales bacterium]